MPPSRDRPSYVDLERALHAERAAHAETRTELAQSRRELASARRSASLNRALLGEALAICRGCDTCNPPVEETDPAS